MKALWAFEPFHQDNANIKGMGSLLEQLVGKTANIEVGFIVTRMENELALAFDIPFEERFSSYPRKLLKKTLSNAQFSVLDKNIHVVDYKTFSNTKTVDQFLSLAKKQGSDLIALHTHSRHGFMRFTLGSFAETAIHKSKKNLLLANPKTHFSPKVKSLFYASDFSPSAKKHLKRVIELSKKLGAQLTVFHAAQIIYKRSIDELNPEIVAYRKKIRRIEVWIEEECKKLKVPCKVIITSEFAPNTDLALKAAKNTNADLIVISAKVGPFAALMGGSMTRQIVRASTKPVLVLK